ncbi:MAG: hypothetical protein PHR45_02215 [Muribaculaceae bacterium]|nr:hypothetical protein [Muribaculaceae bacterium]
MNIRLIDIINENISRQNKIRQDLKEHPTSKFEIWHNKNFGRLTNAQRKLISQISNGEKQHYILHASMLGISTICERYIFWLQHITENSLDATIFYPCANKRKISRCNFLRNLTAYNLDRKNIRLWSQNILIANNKTDSVLATSTFRSSVVARSLCSSLILFTDVNNCASANSKIDSFKRSFYSVVPSAVSPLVIMESNPANFNALFYEKYISAKARLFIPWFDDENNRLKLKTNIVDFWNSLTPFEYNLWNKFKLTLEQINWYRNNVDTDNILYPSTENEAVGNKIEFDVDPPPKTSIGSLPSDVDPPPKLKSLNFKKEISIDCFMILAGNDVNSINTQYDSFLRGDSVDPPSIIIPLGVVKRKLLTIAH